MNFYIKEWPNKMATLMADDGAVLWTFSNYEEAKKVWQDWCERQEKKTAYQIDHLGNNQLIPGTIYET